METSGTTKQGMEKFQRGPSTFTFHLTVTQSGSQNIQRFIASRAMIARRPLVSTSKTDTCD